MNELFIVFVLLIYLFGVVMGKWTESWKSRKLTNGHGCLYWYECTECVPGAVFRVGADSKKHIKQLEDWHREDYHEG